MYIYHALTNALSAHVIHVNLNMIFYTHVEHSPTKTIYIKYYLGKTDFSFHLCMTLWLEVCAGECTVSGSFVTWTYSHIFVRSRQRSKICSV